MESPSGDVGGGLHRGTSGGGCGRTSGGGHHPGHRGPVRGRPALGRLVVGDPGNAIGETLLRLTVLVDGLLRHSFDHDVLESEELPPQRGLGPDRGHPGQRSRDGVVLDPVARGVEFRDGCGSVTTGHDSLL